MTRKYTILIYIYILQLPKNLIERRYSIDRLQVPCMILRSTEK